MNIPIEKLLAVDHIIVHANCADGMASAIILHDALPNAKISFMSYGTQALRDLRPAPGQLFCDFTPPKERFEEFRDAIVLDHHAPMAKFVRSIPYGVYSAEHSGATLAYERVWRQKPNRSYDVPDSVFERVRGFALRARVHDLWQQDDPQWQKALVQAKTLHFFPPERLLCADFFEEAHDINFGEMCRVGELLVEKDKASAQKALEKADRFGTRHGVQVVMFPGTHLTNDASDLEENADLIVGFGYTETADGKAALSFSLRSRKGFDCAAFCVQQGGGGHTQAAGFTLRQDILGGHQNDWNPHTVFRLLINSFSSL